MASHHPLLEQKKSIIISTTLQTTLPHDLIIFEIFTRLPAKSLIRFRCVSKSWCNSLSSPLFIKTHLTRAIERDHLNLFLLDMPNIGSATLRRRAHFVSPSLTRMYNIEGDSFDKATKFNDTFVTLKAAYDDSELKLLGSCNGLVCLLRKDNGLVCLLNPCTKEYRIVKFDKRRFLSYDNNVYGFGYDPYSDDYKLVEMVSDKDVPNGFHGRVNNYSLSHTSCLMTSYSGYQTKNRKDLGVYLNGGLHWIGYVKGYVNEEVICFDVTEMVFREVHGPNCEYYNVAYKTSGVFGGKLCVVYKCFDTDFEVWVMKEYGVRDSWSKLFSIKETVMHSIHVSKPLDFSSSQKQKRPDPTPLCFAKNGEIILRAFGILVLYHLKEETTRKLENCNLSVWTRVDRAVVYVASLVPLQSGTYLGPSNGVKREEQAYERRLHLTSGTNTNILF